VRLLKILFPYTGKDVKRFLLMSASAAICLIGSMILFSVSWGTIPALVLLAIAAVIFLAVWILYWPIA
jgi:hypothetical protein